MTIKTKIHRPYFEILFFFFVLLLSCIYTYPLITNFSGIFFGPPSDSLGGISHLWWLKFSYINNIPLNFNMYEVFPFGVDHANEPFPYLSIFIEFVTTIFTNEIFSYNFLKIISFPLVALTTFLLLYYLTKDRMLSVLVGIVYSFSPFHVIHNMVHSVNLYWVPLALLFLIKLLKEGGYRNAVLFALFWGITFICNPYFGYFIGLILPVFLIFQLILSKDIKGKSFQTSYIKTALLCLFVFSLTVFPMIYPMVKGIFLDKSKEASEIVGLVRSFSDLFIFSAKPLDYLLPSVHNPFLGWLVPDSGMGPLKGHRYTEHTLYLGYSLLFFAGYALYNAVRNNIDKEKRYYIYLFLAVAITAVILSAPPFIPLSKYKIDFQTREVFTEYKIYLPQYVLFKILPMFRVYARMGVIVLLAVCVMAAFGLQELLRRINTKKWKFLLLLLFSVLISIEFAEFPPFRLTKVQQPAVYKWLASQPGQFPVVEYPLGDGFDPYTSYEYRFYQRIHTKFLVNGATKGTPADEFRKEIIDISKEKTIDKLKSIGVKYIILHKYKYVRGNEYVPLDWLTTPPRDKIFPLEYNDGRIPDLKRVKEKIRLIKDFKDSVVYEIIND